jgi:hypothetical protein
MTTPQPCPYCKQNIEAPPDSHPFHLDCGVAAFKAARQAVTEQQEQRQALLKDED